MNLSRSSILLVGILALAAFLRLYNIEAKMRFIWDEGRDMLAIRHMLVNRDITLFGPFNEIGNKKDFFGVFHYYLMAPALWLAHYNPVGPAIFTAVLGIISVGLLYWLARRYYPTHIALAITSLYAVSPLVVHQVSWPWNPNTTPFFALLFLLCLEMLKQHKRVAWSILAGFLLGLLFQLHYFTITLGLAWVLTMFSSLNHQSSRRKIRHWITFISAFIFPNLTFVLFDLTHDHFYWNILKATLAGGTEQQYLTPTIYALLVNPLFYTKTVLQGLFEFPTFITGLLTLGFFALLFYSLFKLKPNVVGWFTISWLGMMVLVGLFPLTVNDYHSNYLWFGLVLFFTVCIDKVVKKTNRYAFPLIIGLLSLYFVSNNHVFTPPDWSENMPLIRNMSNAIVADAKTNSYDAQTRIAVAALTDADARASRYRYFLIASGLEPVGIDQYPNADVLYIISIHDENASKQNPAWELQTFINLPWQEIYREGESRVFRAEKK